ncbi:MAG TPA: hypothetical protein VM889_07820 [Candidatus Thermoplasmatota archaeon]|nr:hypothetical protein [Candidatus Thermoplasmatota archaeon]
MGAETSSTHMIFFIVATALAVVVSALLSTQVYDIANTVRDRGASLGDNIATDIAIINDPGQVPNNPVIIYVKNTGQRTIDHTTISVIIDGVHRTHTVTLLGGAAAWQHGDVAEFSITLTLASGDHRVRVVTANGIEDDLRFRI